MPIFKFGFDASGIVSGVKTATRSLGRLSKSAFGVKDVLGKVFSPVSLGIGAIAGGFGAKTLIETSDAYINMGSQLEFLTGSSQAAAEAQRQLYEMSQLTGTSVLANSKALTRFQLAQEQTGLSTEQNIKVLGAINSLIIKSGVSAQEASAGMVQLGQALASGRLAGDEFRTLSETMPALMMEIANSLDVPIGQLKKMGAEGELTSERLGQVFLNMAESGNQLGEDLPNTFSRMWQKVVNASQRMWVAISDRTGIMSFITNAVEDLAIWVENNTHRITQFFVDIKNAAVDNWPTIRDFFLDIVDRGIAFYDWFTTTNWGSVWDSLKPVIDVLKSVLKWVNKAIEGWKFLFGLMGQRGELLQAEEDLMRQQQFVEQARNQQSSGFYNYATGGFDQTGTNIQQASQSLFDENEFNETPQQISNNQRNVNVYVNQKQSRSDIVNTVNELQRFGARS